MSGIFVGLGTRVFLLVLRWTTHIVSHGPMKHVPYFAALPLILPLSVFLIRKFAPTARGHGTEAVIAAVHEQFGRVDWRVAPVKLAATVLTLAFGGSVGKEGPCAQIGASISSLFADILKLGDEDRRRLVICGISGGFAAVFGTPVAGALFGIEVLYLGRIEYSVLLPCLISGIAAHLVCGTIAPSPLLTEQVGHLSQTSLAFLSAIFGFLCGLLALAFIELMRSTEHFLQRFSSRPYLVAFTGGCALAATYSLFGTGAAGLGIPTIDSALNGVVPALGVAFGVKMLTTTITLETGGSGGIVTPLFYIGATFGALFGHIFHLPVGLFASFGFIAVAAAATNAPIAFSVMAMSILPPSIGVFASLSACAAYLLVGHRSVYASQKLGTLKTAGLTMKVGVPIGQVSPRDMHVRSGSGTERMLNLERKIRKNRRRGQ